MEGTVAADSENDEQLVAELHRLGVQHLVRLRPQVAYAPLPAAALIAGLAGHREARFRGALIPLFLRRPSLSGASQETLNQLSDAAADTLRCYYQAAAYLRAEMETALRQHSDDVAPLPDLFSAELGLPAAGSVPVADALAALGERHAQLSGRAYNWAGSYRQHLPLFLKQLQRSPHADISA
jgi:hypothetical protein